MALPGGYRFPDVSRYRPVADFDRFCRAYPVAAAKASEGATWHDPEWDRFRAETQKRDTVPVAYHFLRSEPSVAAQVDNFLAAIGDGRGIAVCLDVERSAAGTNPTMAQADQWVDAVAKKLGRPRSSILVYLPRWWWLAHGGRSGVLGDCLLWNSHYSSSPFVGDYAGGETEVIQYTDRGPIEGVTLGGDMNVAIGMTATELRRRILPGKTPAPKPKPEPEEDELSVYEISAYKRPVRMVVDGHVIGYSSAKERQNRVGAFKAQGFKVPLVRLGRRNYDKISSAGGFGRIRTEAQKAIDNVFKWYAATRRGPLYDILGDVHDPAA